MFDRKWNIFGVLVLLAAFAYAGNVEYVGDWQINYGGKGGMDFVGTDQKKSVDGIWHVGFSKKISINGKEQYRPAWVMLDIGAARPTYLTGQFLISCFRLFCPTVLVNDKPIMVGSANRGKIEILRVTDEGDIVFKYEYIYRTWPVATDKDLFKLSGEMTLAASQDGIVVDSTGTLENISGESIQIDKRVDETNPMFKAGSQFKMLLLQSNYSCEAVSNNKYPEYLKESHKGRGNNGDYLFHTDDMKTKEKVFLPPYVSRSIFFRDKKGQTEYRIKNDKSEYLSYGVDWMKDSCVIRGALGSSDTIDIRSYNDIMPHVSWSVSLPSTSGSLGNGLKGTLTHSVQTQWGPDGDNVSAGYAPSADYFLKNNGVIPADFKQEFHFIVSNPPQGTVIRRPAAPKILTASREKLKIETGIDLPDGYENLPVTVQLYLSETPLIEDTMPPVALEKNFDLSKGKEIVELDISSLSSRDTDKKYGRVLVHFNRNFAVDYTSGYIAFEDFQLNPELRK